MSISGNFNTNTALCNILESQMSNETVSWKNLSFIICIEQAFNSSKTKEIFCKSSKFSNYTQNHCNKTLLNLLNLGMKTFNNLDFFFDASRKLFISLHWGRQNQGLKSNQIEINKNTKKIIRNRFHITMTADTTLDVELIYRSRCMNNYYGTNCENHCVSMDNISGHYNCTDDGKRVCLSGWRGIACNEAICNKCVNGQCFAPEKCKCSNGWTGDTCTECQKRHDCKHGTCAARGPFTCECTHGWGGNNCDIDLRYCSNHKGLCQNNGVCYSYYKDTRLQYICTCEPGYSGRHCQIKTGDCTYSNCNSKNCSTTQSGARCQCYDGHSGSYCQINNTIQLEFQSMQKNMKSGGFCLNAAEGYSCSCSKNKVEICQCRFHKCPQNTVCSNQSKPHRFCSNDSDINLQREFYISFGLEHFSMSSVITRRTVSQYSFPNDPYFKIYMGLFVCIPIVLGLLLLLAIKFTFKFRKRSTACTRTIHNDLCLNNNNSLRNNSVHFPEQRLLLQQLPLFTSSPSDSCLNNIFVIPDPGCKSSSMDKDESWKSHESEDVDLSTKKSPIICNPNLLINHYKDMSNNLK